MRLVAHNVPWLWLLPAVVVVCICCLRPSTKVLFFLVPTLMHSHAARIDSCGLMCCDESCVAHNVRWLRVRPVYCREYSRLSSSSCTPECIFFLLTPLLSFLCLCLCACLVFAGGLEHQQPELDRPGHVPFRLLPLLYRRGEHALGQQGDRVLREAFPPDNHGHHPRQLRQTRG